MESIQIRMLGEFSLEAGGVRISDAGNRAKKVWCLLSYLICSRERAIPQQKLIDLFWPEDAASTNPENALRITLHRLRATLDQLWPGAGRDLILHKDGGYAWNSQVPITLDCDRFDTLCAAPASDKEELLSQYLEALEMYRGEFLPKQSSENWVVPVSVHFHNNFLRISMEAAQLLLERRRYEEAAACCRKAAATEPYHEPLYQLMMQVLSAQGDTKGAAAVYDNLAKRLFDDFGIRPSEETRAVYRATAHSPSDRTLPMDEVLEELQEPTNNLGAMVCDYDYFKVLCYAESRAMERSGNVTHVALLSVSSTDKPLTKRSQDRIMEQLGEQLRLNLRRGDTISRCSITQYIVMLPNCNYENSCMVCRRILAAFHRAHPHVTAKINYMVQPLSPSICVP